MIKKEYIGKIIRVSSGGKPTRAIEVFEGMTIEEIEFLKKNKVDVLEKPKKTRKKKEVKMVEPDPETPTDELQ